MADGCTHLAAVEPFVPAAIRVPVSDSTTAIFMSASLDATIVSTPLPAHAASPGPPSLSRTSHTRPLRI